MSWRSASGKAALVCPRSLILREPSSALGAEIRALGRSSTWRTRTTSVWGKEISNKRPEMHPIKHSLELRGTCGFVTTSNTSHITVIWPSVNKYIYIYIYKILIIAIDYLIQNNPNIILCQLNRITIEELEFENCSPTTMVLCKWLSGTHGHQKTPLQRNLPLQIYLDDNIWAQCRIVFSQPGLSSPPTVSCGGRQQLVWLLKPIFPLFL